MKQNSLNLRVGVRTKNWTTIGIRKESFYIFQRTKINRIKSISPNKFRFSNNTDFGISNEKIIIYMYSCGKYGDKGA